MDFTPDFELAGYAEVRASVVGGVEGVPWNLYERIRPSLEIRPAPRVSATAVVEASLYQGRDTTQEAIDLIESSTLGPFLGSAGCSYEESARYASVSDYLSVERLHVDFNLPSVDLTIGRQAMRWGSGLAFHPTDVYSEVLLTEPWREPRGVNAVKAFVPLGNHSVVGALILDDDLSGMYPGKDGTFEGVPVSGALRATLNVGATDLTAVTTAKADGELFVGGDLRGTLGVGWWVEGGYHADDKTLEVVGGVDYSFNVLQMLYLAAEYRYDGSGSAPADYDFTQRFSGGGALSLSCPDLDAESETSSGYTITPDLSNASPDQEARQTLGRHYVDGVVRLTVNNDISLTTSAVLNLEDLTGVVIPDAQFNLGQRLALHVGAQVPFGAEGEFRPSTADMSIRVVGPGVNAAADLSSLVPDFTVQSWLRYSF